MQRVLVKKHTKTKLLVLDVFSRFVPCPVEPAVVGRFVCGLYDMWWVTGSAPDFWGRGPAGSKSASPTMILRHCRIIVKNCKKGPKRIKKF